MSMHYRPPGSNLASCSLDHGDTGDVTEVDCPECRQTQAFARAAHRRLRADWDVIHHIAHWLVEDGVEDVLDPEEHDDLARVSAVAYNATAHVPDKEHALGYVAVVRRLLGLADADGYELSEADRVRIELAIQALAGIGRCP